MSAFRYLHHFYAGFTHRVGVTSNGVYAAFDDVYRRWAGRDTLVEYFPWYLNPAGIAKAIVDRDVQCRAVHGHRLRVHQVGYSFGGQTAVHVAAELKAIAADRLFVDELCLCDAVARCGRLGWIRAANPWSVIRIPTNVLDVRAFVQNNPRWRPRKPFFFPAGHHLRWGTCDVVPMELDAEHTEIDNTESFHSVVRVQAERLHAADPRRQPGCAVLPFTHRPSPLDVDPRQQRRSA